MSAGDTYEYEILVYKKDWEKAKKLTGQSDLNGISSILR